MLYFMIGLGGALGSIARYAASAGIAKGFGDVFPWGTLFVNVTGSFIIGFFAVLTGPDGRVGVSPDVRAFFMVGVCGGYTTFSSFSLQTLTLARDGDTLRAGLNVVVSVVVCLVGVWLGTAAGAAINQMKGA